MDDRFLSNRGQAADRRDTVRQRERRQRTNVGYGCGGTAQHRAALVDGWALRVFPLLAGWITLPVGTAREWHDEAARRRSGGGVSYASGRASRGGFDCRAGAVHGGGQPPGAQ